MFNKSHIVYLSNEEVSNQVSRHEAGMPINFNIDDIMQEISYRKILNEWNDDGCGHDLSMQNEGNYGTNDESYESDYE